MVLYVHVGNNCNMPFKTGAPGVSFCCQYMWIYFIKWLHKFHCMDG